MLGFLKWLGPSGIMTMLAVLGVGGWYAMQKGQIWWQKEKVAYCESQLADRQAQLDELTRQVQQLSKERDNAQLQANSAWWAYAKREQQRERQYNADRIELEGLRGTYNCDLPPGLRDSWDRWNRGPSRNQSEGERRTAPILSNPSHVVGDRE